MSEQGSARFKAYSGRLSRALEDHSREAFPPDAQKTLRRFSMREAAEFIRVNQNTFRHYITTMADRIPVGERDKSNRRYFSAREFHEIQRVLFEEGKIRPEHYPRRRAGEKCQVVTCFNLKGGVSKTSTATHLAEILALRGYRVLAIDLDAQSSMTNMFGITPELAPDMPSAYDVIRYTDPLPCREAIRKTYFPNIDLLPGSMDVIEFEYETALSFRTPDSSKPFHGRLADAIDQVQQDYDVVIFDTPPQMSFAVIAALFASTGVLIPLNASMLDAMSLASFLGLASELMGVVEQHAPDHSFDFIKFLITRYEATDQPQVQMAGFLRTVLGTAVMSTEFVKSTAIGDAANTKQPVFEIEPRDVNKKTYDRVIEAIGRIADELEAEFMKSWGRS